jgi:hypothetical protein
MKNMIISKGSYGYIANHRWIAAARTLLFFGVSIGLYIMGYVTTGSNRNLLTVVAVLGCLPACKSLVNLIVFIRASGCSEALKDRVCIYDEKLRTFYDMYFTSYQKNFAVSHMVLKGNVLCGVTESAGCDCSRAEKHLDQILLQEGIKNITVKIYSDTDKYIDRLGQIIYLDADESRSCGQIIDLLYSIVI